MEDMGGHVSMSPATSWIEASQTGAGWQEGEPQDSSEDFYVDFLFEGTGFHGLVASTYTEASVAAASYTEASVAAPTWTEHTL